VVEVVKRVRACVVNIHSERTARGPAAEELFALAPSQNRINGMGTGILIDPRGYIITNQHVVEEVSSIRVRLGDGTTSNARVVARDYDDDLALLKIDVGRALPTMPLGSARDLAVGETVIAIGNAYGYEHTVSVGVVSATGRDVTLNKEISYRSLIQTDTAINPGNSGGPLINLDGQLVGVNVAIRAGAQGIGFAIPVDTMIEVAGEMIRDKLCSDVACGVVCKDRVATLPGQLGWSRRVVVENIAENSPAAKAGLRDGDELVQVASLAVANSLDFDRALLGHRPGEKLPLRVRRGSAEQQLDLTLEGRELPAADLVWQKLGMRFQDLPSHLLTQHHPQLNGGLIVADLQNDGAASRAGIRRGDILVGLHLWEVVNVDNVLYVLKHPDLNTFRPLRFYILRGGQVHGGVIAPAE
jgi:serine protease Do